MLPKASQVAVNPSSQQFNGVTQVLTILIVGFVQLASTLRLLVIAMKDRRQE